MLQSCDQNCSKPTIRWKDYCIRLALNCISSHNEQENISGEEGHLTLLSLMPPWPSHRFCGKPLLHSHTRYWDLRWCMWVLSVYMCVVLGGECEWRSFGNISMASCGSPVCAHWQLQDYTLLQCSFGHHFCQWWQHCSQQVNSWDLGTQWKSKGATNMKGQMIRQDVNKLKVYLTHYIWKLVLERTK